MGIKKKKTSTCVNGGMNPKWSQTLEFESQKDLKDIIIELWDEDIGRDDSYGQATLVAQEFGQAFKTIDIIRKNQIIGVLDVEVQIKKTEEDSSDSEKQLMIKPIKVELQLQNSKESEQKGLFQDSKQLFCLVRVGEEELKTEFSNKDQLQWNDNLEFKRKNQEQKAEVQVYDDEHMSNQEKMASCSVDLKFVDQFHDITHNLFLYQKEKKIGQIQIQVKSTNWKPNSGLGLIQQNIANIRVAPQPLVPCQIVQQNVCKPQVQQVDQMKTSSKKQSILQNNKTSLNYNSNYQLQQLGQPLVQ